MRKIMKRRGKPAAPGLCSVAFSILCVVVAGCGAKSDLWDMPGTFAGPDAGSDADADEAGEDVEAEEPDMPPEVSTWIVRMGGPEQDMARSAVETPGGILVVGQTGSFVQNPDPLMFDIDLWVILMDPDGAVLLQESLGGTGYDEANAVALGPGGNAVAAGSTESFGAGWTDMWVLDLDTGGRVAAQKAVGSEDWDHAYALAVMSDGGLALAGTFMGGEGLVRLDGSGRVAWHAVMHLVNVYAVAETADGGIAVAGNWAGQDIWIGKLGEAGTLLWQRKIGGVRSDSAWGMFEAGDGTLVVCGNTEPFTTISETWPLDMWIGRLDRDGTLLWQRSVGGEGGESANSAVEAPDGGIIVAGTASTGADEDYDVAVLKLDADGDIAWQTLLGGSGYEEGRFVTLTHDGGIVAVGSVSDDASGGIDVLVVKLGPNGELQGPCGLVHGGALSSIESRLPVSDAEIEPRIEGDVFQQPGVETTRPTGAYPVRLCPEP